MPHYHSSMAEGKVDGSTRALLVREVECLRSKALDKVLEEHPDREARPVLVSGQGKHVQAFHQLPSI